MHAPGMAGCSFALLLPLCQLPQPGTADDLVPPDGVGMVVARGDSEPLLVPAGEVLEYVVLLDLGISDSRVGRYRLSAGVEPFIAGLPVPGQELEGDAQVGWFRGEASGHYLGFDLEHTLETRILPRAWPRVIHRDTQGGKKGRRHELKLGEQEGATVSWSRKDSHCRGCERREHFVDGLFTSPHHCTKCQLARHRVWREPETRAVPQDAIDMLSAIYLSRSMLRAGREQLTFPLASGNEVWNLNLIRGGRRAVETPAGTFSCREIRISPSTPEGEEQEEDFRGLLGVNGTLHMWLEERTGVPVLIGGAVPFGPLDLDVSIELTSFRGTPEEFRPSGR